jgi:hypothetical protein
MTPIALDISDVESYLAATGWVRTTDTWRGASVWTAGATEVLVPPTAELGDAPLRLRELFDRLAEVEGRNAEQIAGDIAQPHRDSAGYRCGPASAEDGVPLVRGALAVGGLRRLVGAATRTVVEGPHRNFTGTPPPDVLGFLGSVSVVSETAAGVALTLHLPVGQPAGVGRAVTLQLHDATAAFARWVEHDDDHALDDVALTGASASFGTALGDLAGPGPFALDFRWGHGRPAPLAPTVWTFPAGSGPRIRRAAAGLRTLSRPGPATVVGRVETLHDAPDGIRWRVRVRGRLIDDPEHADARGIWVRLPGPRVYSVAVAAHREGRTVRVIGTRDPASPRQELAVPPDGLTIVDHPTP